MSEGEVLLLCPQCGGDIQPALEAEGFPVHLAQSSRGVLDRIRTHPPAALVVEMFLPEHSGFAICRSLRDSPATEALPILMITGCGFEAENDRILALEIGADDVIPRPFFPRELALRVRAVIRRASRKPPGAANTPRIELGPFEIHLDRRLIQHRGRQLDLTRNEFAILALLARRAGQVLTREEILNGVWGADETRTPRVVDTYVKSLRRKLHPDGECIETVRGVGYRLDPRGAAA